MTDDLVMPDISHHQCVRRPDGTYIPITVEDFGQAVAAFGATWHVTGIWHKATQGNGFVSPVFGTHVDRCGQVGFTQGAYHFVDTLDQGDGTQQAEHFYDTVEPYLDAITFLCIDWERAARFLALELAERLRGLAGPDLIIGDYIGSHARSQGGQLPGMGFHIVPQYGPAELDPRYATDPLSAWQYTNGEVNGTEWPNGVPGIGPCDMSVVYRPADFGFGDQPMAITDQDAAKIAKAIVSAKITASGGTAADGIAAAVAQRQIHPSGLKAADAWRAAAETKGEVAALPNASDIAAAVITALPQSQNLTDAQIVAAVERGVTNVLTAGTGVTNA